MNRSSLAPRAAAAAAGVVLAIGALFGVTMVVSGTHDASIVLRQGVRAQIPTTWIVTPAKLPTGDKGAPFGFSAAPSTGYPRFDVHVALAASSTPATLLAIARAGRTDMTVRADGTGTLAGLKAARFSLSGMNASKVSIVGQILLATRTIGRDTWLVEATYQDTTADYSSVDAAARLATVTWP